MERLINRRQQGDLGEASAIEWLTRQGATVSVPFGHSPDYDLVAEFDGYMFRVQVKTTTQSECTRRGSERWTVSICTNGGNQSWTGLSKRFDPTRAEALFVLVGDGRRWFIPAAAVEGSITVRLGGTKYSEFEIEPARQIQKLVYGPTEPPLESSVPSRGSAGVGEPGRSVKSVPELLSGFDSHLPHSDEPGSRLRLEQDQHKLGRPGQTTIGRRRLMTMPHVPFTEAGLGIGDRLRFRADGPGRLVVERIEPPRDSAPGRQTALASVVRDHH